MGQRVTYWSCGGDVLARPCHRLTNADVVALADLHRDEIRAATNAGELAAARSARARARELARAIAAALQWRRAAGRAPVSRPQSSHGS